MSAAAAGNPVIATLLVHVVLLTTTRPVIITEDGKTIWFCCGECRANYREFTAGHKAEMAPWPKGQKCARCGWGLDEVVKKEK